MNENIDTNGIIMLHYNMMADGQDAGFQPNSATPIY